MWACRRHVWPPKQTPAIETSLLPREMYALVDSKERESVQSNVKYCHFSFTVSLREESCRYERTCVSEMSYHF